MAGEDDSPGPSARIDAAATRAARSRDRVAELRAALRRMLDDDDSARSIAQAMRRLLKEWLLSGSGVMGSGLVVNRPREAESLGVGPDRDVDPLVALGAEESESHGGPDQVDDPARRGEVL